MSDTRRPIVLIPARFSDSASALRYRAEVGARALVEAVFRAGGEPLLLHPHAPGGVADLDEVRARLAVADAVLLPGGGDLDSSWAGQDPDPSEYDVDIEQDAFDLALARAALETELPLLAICRGLEVVNVALGGDLVQDMAASGKGEHRHLVHQVDLTPGSAIAGIAAKVRAPGLATDSEGPQVTASCYHHQCVSELAPELAVTARASDGVVEAVEFPERQGWFVGVQWHPEDTFRTDPVQLALFCAFVDAAARR
jgi:putative glutamine amidotransferase